MLLRFFLKGWVRAGLWFRFRETRLVFHAPIPLDEPAVLAGNHQNGLLDTMTVCTRSPKVPFTLSRGSLFNNGFSRWFLGSARMIPVWPLARCSW